MADEILLAQTAEELEDYESIYAGEEIDDAIGEVRTKSLTWDAKYAKPQYGIPVSDLSEEVRASLAKADTAIQQESDTSGFATETDLTAHTGNTDVHIQSGERAAWDAKYTKPSGGIPSTDLESVVQSALSAAATAVQPAAIQTLANTVNSISETVSGNEITELIVLPESGTALTANKIYNIASSNTVGTYSFVAPVSGGWAHGIFTTAGSGTRSFESGAKFVGGEKPDKASTTYEFDVYNGVWAFAEVE